MSPPSGPEGVFPPDVVALNSTSVRVLWAAPLVPNGAISNYSLYLDEELHTSTDATSGALELTGLLPFTVYEVQVSSRGSLDGEVVTSGVTCSLNPGSLIMMT